MKTLFIKMFEPFLATFVASLHAMSSGQITSSAGAVPTSWNFAKAFEGWDGMFDKVLRGLEDKAAQVRVRLGSASALFPGAYSCAM
jgi:signal recognition particle receptor subunit alpha